MIMLPSFLTLSLIVISTHAQSDWGTVGAWELLSPTTSGPQLAFRGATASTGCLIVTSNDTDGTNGGTIGATSAYAYDVALNVWSAWPDLPVPIGDPFTVDVGGQVFVIDELNVNSIFFIDASAARSRIGQTWTTPSTITGGPIGRFGMRFAGFGAILYAFGGVELATGIMHSDMYAIGSGTIITGQTLPAPSWSLVASDNTPGFPSPRVGYTLTTFGTVLILFGGVNVLPSSPVGTLPSVCFSPSSSSMCEFHSHVWKFEPGNPGPPSEMTVTGAQWQRLSGSAGLAPSGRFDMTAGAVGDQLFAYGGTTATGPSSELWAFNLVSLAWAQVSPSAPAPSLATDLGYGVGAVIGRHLYHYAQAADANGPIVGTGQLWRWAPVASSGGASTSTPTTSTLSSGATASVVIGLLIGLANLGLLIALVRASDALSSLKSFFISCIDSTTSSTSKTNSPAGFYTSSNATSNATAQPWTGNASYVSPPPSI
jgi:hypothetical protein